MVAHLRRALIQKQWLLLFSSLDGGPLGKTLLMVGLVTGGNMVFIG